jgi:protein TonB
MHEGGFFERKRISPTSLTAVILLHGAALTALALSKMEVPVMKVFTPLQVDDYTEPPEPEPLPQPDSRPQAQPRTQIDYVPPTQPDLPKTDFEVDHRPATDVIPFDPGPAGEFDARPADPPKPFVQPTPAQMLSTGTVQPPYPASEQRAGAEGNVAIRVTIGVDGRVIRAEKVSATSEAFYRATERYALRSWRFRPATVDGKPVESSKVITVRFELD